MRVYNSGDRNPARPLCHDREVVGEMETHEMSDEHDDYDGFLDAMNELSGAPEEPQPEPTVERSKTPSTTTEKKKASRKKAPPRTRPPGQRRKRKSRGTPTSENEQASEQKEATERLVAKVAKKLATYIRRNDRKHRREMYELVVGELHGGDIAAYRANKDPTKSLSAVCRRPELAGIPRSKSRIQRAVVAHAVDLELERRGVVPASGQPELSTEHLAALDPMMDNTDEMAQLAGRAMQDEMSCRELAKKVRTQRPKHGSTNKNGRPLRGTLNGDARRLRGLVERLPDGEDRKPADHATWPDDELAVVRADAERVREWVETVLAEVSVLEDRRRATAQEDE